MPQPQSQQLFRTSHDRTSAISRDSVSRAWRYRREGYRPRHRICPFLRAILIPYNRSLEIPADRRRRRRTGPVVLA